MAKERHLFSSIIKKKNEGLSDSAQGHVLAIVQLLVLLLGTLERTERNLGWTFQKLGHCICRERGEKRVGKR